MAIDETGLTKGLVRKLNALRKSVGDGTSPKRFSQSGWSARRPHKQKATPIPWR